jgi:hypothetical protein
MPWLPRPRPGRQFSQEEPAKVEDRMDEDYVIESFQDAISQSLIAKEKEQHVRMSSFEKGDKCLAKYHVDGLYYPGIILLCKDWKRTCVVQFDYDGNEEEVSWEDLQKREL